MRAKVEHPFQIMKRVLGFTQVRYRGMVKNTHRVQVTRALVNLFLREEAIVETGAGNGVVCPVTGNEFENARKRSTHRLARRLRSPIFQFTTA